MSQAKEAGSRLLYAFNLGAIVLFWAVAALAWADSAFRDLPLPAFCLVLSICLYLKFHARRAVREGTLISRSPRIATTNGWRLE